MRVVAMAACVAACVGISAYGVHRPPLVEATPTQWLAAASDGEERAFFFPVTMVALQPEGTVKLKDVGQTRFLCSTGGDPVFQRMLAQTKTVNIRLRKTRRGCLLVQADDPSGNRLLKIASALASLALTIVILGRFYRFDRVRRVFVRRVLHA